VKPAVLLLHGHYLGGWVWEEVERHLGRAGWHVASPTLPGCGRGEEANAARVGLEEHVGFASNALMELAQTAPGAPLLIVAHSYSGLILQTLLGDPAVASRITGGLFLDAALCQPGQCLLDDLLEPAFPGVSAALASQRVQQPPRGFVRAPALDPCTESVSACRRYAEYCGPAPWGSFTDPLASTAVAITQAVAAPRAYARCEKFPLTETIWQQVRGRPGWREEVWPVGHLAMLSHPGRVAEWVHRIVRDMFSGWGE
jgi:alpha-beta hydrolase superfamily lysophospholipase